MTFWLYVLLISMPSLMERASDPLDGWLPSAIDIEDLDCEPMTTEGARQLRPGQVPETPPRGDFLDKRAVICRERLMPRGARRTRDDAILTDLRTTASETAALVAELSSDERARTWLVETYYPDPAVAHKIAFAVKAELFGRKLRLSDRVPTLAAGDLEVIGGLRPQEAYPVACARFAASGSLKPDDALLAVVLRDPRETILHAGVCADGRWRWLR